MKEQLQPESFTQLFVPSNFSKIVTPQPTRLGTWEWDWVTGSLEPKCGREEDSSLTAQGTRGSWLSHTVTQPGARCIPSAERTYMCQLGSQQLKRDTEENLKKGLFTAGGCGEGG